MSSTRAQSAAPPAEAPPAGPSLPARAADDLRAIRTSMERASLFTAVPGRGGMLMGVVGLLGAALASRQADSGSWLAVWLATAAAGVITGACTFAWSGRAAGQDLLGPAGRRFLLALLPPLMVGAALTAALPARGLSSALPGVWLLCYGAGAVTCGLLSLHLIATMGAGFMLLGVLALALPPAAGDACMAAGFGGLQLLFGWLIARAARAAEDAP
jgi:hypothetical protein